MIQVAEETLVLQQILNWAAIAVVAGLMIAIAGWRLATLRDRTFKRFFLPRGCKRTFTHMAAIYTNGFDPP